MSDWNKDGRYHVTTRADLKKAQTSRLETSGVKKDFNSVLLDMIKFNNLDRGIKVDVPYKQVPIVSTVVDKIVNTISATPFQFYRGDPEDENLIFDHPIIRLLNKPNIYLNSLIELFQTTMMFLALKGESFWIFKTSLGQLAGTSTIPSEIVILDPAKMRAVIENYELKGWIYDNRLALTNDDIIHFKWMPNIYNIYRGLSPLECLMLEADTDYRSSVFNHKFFANSAEPGIVIEQQPNTPGYTKEELQTFRELWNQRHQGDTNSNATAVLPVNLSAKTLSINHRAMQFLEQREFSQKTILAKYGVPTGVIFPDANYATALSHRKSFWIDTLIPKCKMIENILNTAFFDKYAPEISGYFDFAMIEELRENYTEKCQQAQILYNMGVPFDQINDQLDLGFDVSKFPEPEEETIEIPIPEDDEEEDEKSLEVKKINPKYKSFADKFSNRQSKIESLLQKKLKRWFFEQRKRVLSTLNDIKSVSKADSENVLFKIRGIFNQDKKDIMKFMNQPIMEAVKEGQELAWDNLDLERTFNPQSHVTLGIVNRRANYITGINDTTFRLISSQVNEGIQAGETISDISGRIRGVYNMATTRSTLIARTESTSLMNDAMMEEYKENNVSKKIWIATSDDRTRDSHAANEAQGSISINDTFSNGQEYPGDGNDPAECCNCRCTLAAEIE